MSKICCEKCKHYCRIVDSNNKVLGYVCAPWVDAMAGDSTWFFPSEECFVKANSTV